MGQHDAPAAPQKTSTPKRTRRPRVGMAWDAAFSFCYADLPPLLAELGAELVFFSPLRDAAPPRGCSALYFPGGYPELHAPQLSTNVHMLDALRALARNGLPIYGECGGYIYPVSYTHLDVYKRQYLKSAPLLWKRIFLPQYALHWSAPPAACWKNIFKTTGTRSAHDRSIRKTAR